MKFRDQDEDDESSTLFDEAMRDVKRLHHKLTSSKRVRETKSDAPSTSPDIQVEFGEELKFVRPGIQTSSLQKLRRGQTPIEATLDLHGLTSAEASIRLQQFIQQSQMAGRSAVRVVHGKGWGSEGRQPVLKSRVRELLMENSAVLAFCSARQQDGGTGAVDVLLRKLKSVR